MRGFKIFFGPFEYLTNHPMSSLSPRGSDLASKPGRVDFELFTEAKENLYTPENPNGAFPLNVAENSLMTNMLQKKVSQILTDEPMPEWVLKYTSFHGQNEVRSRVASFMESFIADCSIPPDSIAFSAGASAVLEVTSFALASSGDVVVIPAPSYPMYTSDLGLKSGLERYDLQSHFEVQDHGSNGPVTTQLLDEALKEISEKGKRFRMLLITTPDNPTGCMYSASQLEELASWCEAHKIHLLVNEIYALSRIGIEDAALESDYDSKVSFTSFAKIMSERRSDYLHLCYAFSKDFAMSGLRFGVIHSLNEDFLKAYGNANLPHLVSNHTQWLVGELLGDFDFVQEFIRKNTHQITASYKTVIKTLRENNIPYIPSRGSLFVWADFSRYMDGEDDAAEERLWLNIYKNSGVLLTPGFGFQHQKKGLFRIVHTAVSLGHLKVAMEQMDNYLLSLFA